MFQISEGLRYLASSICTAALVGSGIGIGLIFSALQLSYSMNPKIKKELFAFALIGFALVEAMALFGMMMAFFYLYGL